MEKIKHNRFSKVLVLLMAVMMVLTMMPNGMGGGTTLAWAETTDNQEIPKLFTTQNGDTGDESNGADATQSPDVNGEKKDADETGSSTESGKIAVTLSGHDAYFTSMKLYKWDGTQKQGEDLLGTVTKETEGHINKYSVSLDAGEYFVEGYLNIWDTP